MPRVREGVIVTDRADGSAQASYQSFLRAASENAAALAAATIGRVAAGTAKPE